MKNVVTIFFYLIRILRTFPKTFLRKFPKQFPSKFHREIPRKFPREFPWKFPTIFPWKFPWDPRSTCFNGESESDVEGGKILDPGRIK